MIPIYFLVGLINIFAKHNNYGIQIKDPDFDVRVRRSIQDTAIEEVFKLHNNIQNDLKTDLTRDKRYAYYKKVKITEQNLPRYNYTNGAYVTQNNGNGSLRNNITKNNDNKYTIFNSTWNYLFDTPRNYSYNGNNSGVNGNSFPGHVTVTNTPINGNSGFQRQNVNNVFRGSYPYGYPAGYGPNTNMNGYKNVIPGYNSKTTTSGYSNVNNTPYFYNYQNPNAQNFHGYFGFNASQPGYNNFNNVPAPYAPGYTPNSANNTGFNNNILAPWSNNYTNILAPYPPGYTQKPVINTALPAPYTTRPGNDPGYKNFAPSGPDYIPNPGNNGQYNSTATTHNNFNNIPSPYIPNPNLNNNNLAPYAPNYIPSPANNGNYFPYNTTPSYNFNNTPAPNTGNNRSVTPGYTHFGDANNLTETTTIIVHACVICNIPCPKFMRRFGKFCVHSDEDDEY